MSRYIDADATELAVVKATTYGDALRAVREQPSIDIVFCKECKYGSDNKVYGCMLNHFNFNDGYHRMYADDFCSYGEVRDE